MRQQPQRPSLLALSALLVFTLVCQPAFGELITGSEDIDDSASTPQYTHEGNTYPPDNPNGFGWDYNYTRSFDGEKLTKHVEIDFDFDEALNWNAQQQADYKAAAESAIENQWNNKAVIRDNSTKAIYPITVDVTTTGPFNYTVEVEQRTVGNINDPVNNPTPTHMTHWHSDETPQVMAHEFGHMLGLYDEYIGGAVDQYPNPTLSDDGLMGLGALNDEPVMYPRYYQQYLDYMMQLNPTGNFSLIVPEPASWLLLAVGLACMAAMRRRRRAG